MVLDFFIIIALIAIIIGTYTDIRTREVPDWLNYSLIAIGIGLNLVYSVVNSDFNYIIRSTFGLIVSVLLGVIMFYTGQWAEEIAR